MSVTLPPNLEKTWNAVYAIVFDDILVIHLPEYFPLEFRIHLYSHVQVLRGIENLFKRPEGPDVGSVDDESLDSGHFPIHAHKLAVNPHVQYHVNPAKPLDGRPYDLNDQVDAVIVHMEALKRDVHISFIAEIYVVGVVGLVGNVFIALQCDEIIEGTIRCRCGIVEDHR